MTNRKRIACFFTGGYTELNAMRGFLRKINPQADYIQLCPTGKRRSKKDIMGRHIDVMDPEQNGLTGKALLDHMLSFLDSNRFREEGYDAILIEDDRDDRFLSLRSDGSSRIDRAAWEKFQQDVRSQVERYAPGIPVLFILAAPEVESWFIADWEHGFGQVFRSFFSRSAPQYYHFFQGKLRRYVNETILTSCYQDRIEEYGYFDSVYRKLSAQLQAALAEEALFEGYPGEEEPPALSYSKRTQGEDMLWALEPQQVLRHCPLFFKDGFLALQKL